MISKIALKDKITEIAGRPWYPVDVARVNNQVVRMALCKGEYNWHKHEQEDELFYVLRGELTIQMKAPYENIALKEGELAVVPKGIEHCPISLMDTYILLFEPYVLNTKRN